MNQEKKRIFDRDAKLKELNFLYGEIELADLIMEYCQFEYQIARVVIKLLGKYNIGEIKKIIEDAVFPYSIVVSDILNTEEIIDNSRCYRRLIKVGLSSKDIIKYRLSKWRRVIKFMKKDNALQISGIMNDPEYIKEIKKRWGDERKEND